jgi:hypothetical protein
VQPRCVTGYLGVRLAEVRTSRKRWIDGFMGRPAHGSLRTAYVKEQRCWKTGAQLTSGDVLRELGLESRLFTNAQRVLRRSSDGVGADYTDGAGRRHKLYTWGDVPVLRKRMEERFEEWEVRPEASDLR